MGLTDNENPFGVLPPGLARSMGRAAGGLLADYVARMFAHRRLRRSTPMEPPPPETKHAFHGGERALLYTVVEDFLSNFGMDGKACLLRAICEVHAHPLTNFGLFGEILKLFFTCVYFNKNYLNYFSIYFFFFLMYIKLSVSQHLRNSK